VGLLVEARRIQEAFEIRIVCAPVKRRNGVSARSRHGGLLDSNVLSDRRAEPSADATGSRASGYFGTLGFDIKPQKTLEAGLSSQLPPATNNVKNQYISTPKRSRVESAKKNLAPLLNSVFSAPNSFAAPAGDAGWPL
jgi:hypothetical protein